MMTTTEANYEKTTHEFKQEKYSVISLYDQGSNKAIGRPKKRAAGADLVRMARFSSAPNGSAIK